MTPLKEWIKKFEKTKDAEIALNDVNRTTLWRWLKSDNFYVIDKKVVKVVAKVK